MLLCVALVWCTSATAWEWETTGALRGLGAASAAPRIDDVPAGLGLDEASWTAAGVVRGIVVGRSDTTRLEVNVFADGSRMASGGGLGGALGTVGGRRSAYRHPWLEGRPYDDTPWGATVGVDRLLVRRRVGDWTLSVGRMPLSLSVTSLFTPNDLFAPFSAASINRVYKPGVDAAQVDYAVGAMTTVSVIAVAAWDEDGRPESAATLLRGTTLLGNFQVSALAGRTPGRTLVALSAQGDVGDINVRAEGHVGLRDGDTFRTRDGQPMWPGDAVPLGERVQVRAALGADARLPWRNGMVMAECMVVSDGAANPRDYLNRALALAADDLPNLGRYYAAISGGFELLPILRTGVFALMNVGDGSGLAGLSLSWNASDEADIALGGFLPWGTPARFGPLVSQGAAGAAGGTAGTVTGLLLESEYGAGGPVGYLEARWYF